MDHDRNERPDQRPDQRPDSTPDPTPDEEGSLRQPDPTSGELEDAGPRPGMHPEVKRSGTSRSTAITLVVFLVLAALLYAAIALGIVGSG